MSFLEIKMLLIPKLAGDSEIFVDSFSMSHLTDQFSLFQCQKHRGSYIFGEPVEVAGIDIISRRLKALRRSIRVKATSLTAVQV